MTTTTLAHRIADHITTLQATQANGWHVVIGTPVASKLTFMCDIANALPDAQLSRAFELLVLSDASRIVIFESHWLDVSSHEERMWIGQALLKDNPNTHFIVPTNEPLICQAAYSGSLWHIEGEILKRITGEDRKRLVYGNILEAYSTGLFGRIGRSSQAQTKLARVAALSMKELDEDLGDDERAELIALQDELPNTPHKRGFSS